MGGNTSSPKPADPTVYAGGFEYLAEVTRTESVAVFTNETFSLSTKCGAELRRRFGGVKFLANQGIKAGQMIPVKYNGRYVYYLVVRKTPYNNTAEADFQNALNALVAHVDTYLVPKVIFANEIPQGLDRPTFENIITTTMGERLWDFYGPI